MTSFESTPPSLTKPTIVIDAMGGDYAPLEIVKGAVLAAQQYPVRLLLVGPETTVRTELSRYDLGGLDIDVVHADEVIGMDESPATAIRKKRDASIVVAAKCVKQGRAHALVAAGSTGAAMASATLNIGRQEGVDRPAIAVALPTVNEIPSLLLDAGANADCIPEMLLQFARMGSAYMETVYGIERPRVGVMNIGEELGKGNALVHAAFDLMSKDSSLNFIGNVEGNDTFMGRVDVAVCDGFTGNVALKSAEGVCRMLIKEIKAELSENLMAKAGALLAKPALKEALRKVDPSEHGGALLLGIKGICVIAHGSSDAFAITSAVRVAKEAIEKDVLGKIGGCMLECHSLQGSQVS